MELQNSPLIWCVETCLVIDELTRDIGKLLRIFPVDHKVYQQTTIALQQLAMNEKFKIHELTSLCVLKITFFSSAQLMSKLNVFVFSLAGIRNKRMFFNSTMIKSRHPHFARKNCSFEAERFRDFLI